MSGYAVYESKFGLIKIGYEDDYLVFVKKIDNVNDFGTKNNFTDEVYKMLEEYFSGTRKNFDVKYKLVGTEFQKKVWNALLTIPYGETRSYKEIATYVGNDKASRAVGMANNKNPLSIIVPCHRVIGSTNKLVGYAGGLDMKKCLLGMEKENK